MSERQSGSGIIILVAILLVVGAAAPMVSVSSAANEDPDPTLLDVSAPHEVTIGESVELQIDAENRGGRAGHWSSISVSSPSLDERDDETQIQITDASDHTYSSVFTSGSQMYDKYGNTITAKNALVEVGTDGETYWGANEERSLSVEFTPEETGTFVYYVRLTFTDDNDATNKVTHPYSSDWTDQQDFYVLRYEVNVREKPNIQASIVDFDQDSGRVHHGDEVDASATIKNSGNREHTYFVGYSVRGPDGQWRSNDKTTGKTVTLAPGEQRDVPLEWNAQPDVPLGTYDVRTSVWKEADRDNLVTRLDSETRDDVFTVEKSIDAQIMSFDQSSGSYAAGETVTGSVTVKNSGTVEHTFYVGYSGRGPNGNFYDDDGTTGKSVTLSPGESEIVNLAWEIQPDNPSGTYDMTTAVWKTRDGDEFRDRLDEQTRSDVVTVEGPDATDVAKADVISINGYTQSDGPLQLSDGFVRTITVELTDAQGDPVSGINPQLHLPSKKTNFTLISSDQGQYRFKPKQSLALPTGYQDFQLSLQDGQSKLTLREPINSQYDILSHPLQNWDTYGHTERVLVDGREYTALKVSKQTSDGEFVEGWLVFDSEGKLVRDMEVVRKAALTATVSIKFSNNEAMEQFLATEYPNRLRTILAESRGLEYSIMVRDTSASMLGTITSSYLTGGASTVTVGGTQVAQQSAKEATEKAGKELSQRVLKEMAKQYSEDTIRTDVLGAFDSSMRAASHDELEDSIRQSERAGRLLEQRTDGSKWTYTEAQGVWRAYNESMVDGILWSQVRVETMPQGAPKEQLQQIGMNYLEGATGAPVTTFAGLLESGDVGEGYVVALQKTSGYRASFNEDYTKFHTITPIVQQQAIDELGAKSNTEKSATPTGSATIEILDSATGTYEVGESANTEVRVKNTGNEPGRFFVGYSTSAKTSFGRLYFDNKGSTGHWVTLDAGESTRTTLEWRVQPGAPKGTDYDTIVAVWPRFPTEGVQRYDGQRRESAFSVVEGTDIMVTDLTLPDTGINGDPVPAIVTVKNSGSAGSKVLSLKDGDTTLVEQVVYVPKDGTVQIQPLLSFETTGKHRIKAGKHAESISIGPNLQTTTTTPAATSTPPHGTDTDDFATTKSTPRTQTYTTSSAPSTTTVTKFTASSDGGSNNWFGLRRNLPTLPDVMDIISDIFGLYI